MSGFRYRSYVDGPDPLRPPFDVRSAVDALGRAVLAGASPTRALRDLLRRGIRGVRGLDELLRHVRERKEQLRSQGRLDGTLAQARRLLDQAVGQERAVLFPDPSDEARLRERSSTTCPLIRRGDPATRRLPVALFGRPSDVHPAPGAAAPRNPRRPVPRYAAGHGPGHA